MENEMTKKLVSMYKAIDGGETLLFQWSCTLVIQVNTADIPLP